MTARLLITLGCAVAALAALVPAANAAPAPRCLNSEIWARPALAREHQLACEYTNAITVVAAPQHGQLAQFRFDGDYARWTFTPDADAPAMDAIELQLTGPGGTVQKHLDINVIPTSVNSAPTCLPLADAQRSDGLAPVELEFWTSCSDPEHDGMTVHGAGPGTHLDDPSVLAGGHSWTTGVRWRYRTATTNGEESATYWAVDELGARSDDAGISVAIGPGIDRLPRCQARLGGGFEIWTRPGATRNFGLRCDDADGDPFIARVGTPPQHGAFTTFARDLQALPGSATFGLIDVTYVPAAGSAVEDAFTVVAETTPARRVETSFAIVPSELPANGLGMCGYSNRFTNEGVATDLLIECADLEGDQMQAAITSPPDHGTAGPPALLPGRYGDEQIVVRYTPAPGYAGSDAVGITVSDGSATWHEFLIPIEIFRAYVPGPARPVTPGTGRPVEGQAPALAPADQARTALGTRHVRLVKRAGVARVYARKGALRAVAGKPALAVTCGLRCDLQARALVGARSLGRQRMTVRPGRAGIVRISRGAARTLRRGAAGRLTFALRIRADGWAAHSVSVPLRTRVR